MIKIGVLGVGYLGKIHVQLLKKIPGFELVGFYDPNMERRLEAESMFEIPAFDSEDELIEACDALDIVTSTDAHFSCAVKAIRKSKHLFIEKPVSYSIDEAHELLKLSREANIKVQIGHVERFNPAFTAALPHIIRPIYIESHRMGPILDRHLDIPVVLDLMIHDIDWILSVVKSPLRKVTSNGVAVFNDTPDVVNARLDFSNGTIANLTVSHIATEKKRSAEIFQPQSNLSIDFLNKKASIYESEEVLELSGTQHESAPIGLPGDLRPKPILKALAIQGNNAIYDELTGFHHAIVTDSKPPVDIEDGFAALDIAWLILKRMNFNGMRSLY